MATVQQGAKALLFHVPNADLTLGGHNLVGAIIISDFGFTPTAQEVRTQDDDGSTVNITTYDQGAEVTLTCRPFGSTAANAITAAGYFPGIGEECVAVNAASVTRYTDADFTASSPGRKYRVKAASKNAVAGQQVTWNLTLERLDSISSMTALS